MNTSFTKYEKLCEDIKNIKFAIFEIRKHYFIFIEKYTIDFVYSLEDEPPKVFLYRFIANKENNTKTFYKKETIANFNVRINVIYLLDKEIRKFVEEFICDFTYKYVESDEFI